MLQIGDKIRILSRRSCSGHNCEGSGSDTVIGNEYTIKKVGSEHTNATTYYYSGNAHVCDCAMGLQFEVVNKPNNKSMLNIKEQFALAITPEPMKSFRKAGITNGDNLLTPDGQLIFLSYLLTKNQDDFKTTIVGPMLAEQKDN